MGYFTALGQFIVDLARSQDACYQRHHDHGRDRGQRPFFGGQQARDRFPDQSQAESQPIPDIVTSSRKEAFDLLNQKNNQWDQRQARQNHCALGVLKKRIHCSIVL